MSLIEIASLVLQGMTFLMACIVVPIWHHVNKIRNNEFKHIGQDIARIEEDIKDVRKVLQQHVADHLNRR